MTSIFFVEFISGKWLDNGTIEEKKEFAEAIVSGPIQCQVMPEQIILDFEEKTKAENSAQYVRILRAEAI